eukprot:TRINITY_DN2163_c0_g1_i2.p1 TRINITY_DN2163_c0_g1~~TRINITY_DN2163_c0_g1_i2.p1  ORF type:complete len:1687 (-),score=99.08 TRINITY_DN2163_c0_g1_i2:102-5162(-)
MPFGCAFIQPVLDEHSRNARVAARSADQACQQLSRALVRLRERESASPSVAAVRVSVEKLLSHIRSTCVRLTASANHSADVVGPLAASVSAFLRNAAVTTAAADSSSAASVLPCRDSGNTIDAAMEAYAFIAAGHLALITMAAAGAPELVPLVLRCCPAVRPFTPVDIMTAAAEPLHALREAMSLGTVRGMPDRTPARPQGRHGDPTGDARSTHIAASHERAAHATLRWLLVPAVAEALRGVPAVAGGALALPWAAAGVAVWGTSRTASAVTVPTASVVQLDLLHHLAATPAAVLGLALPGSTAGAGASVLLAGAPGEGMHASRAAALAAAVTCRTSAAPPPSRGCPLWSDTVMHEREEIARSLCGVGSPGGRSDRHATVEERDWPPRAVRGHAPAGWVGPTWTDGQGVRAADATTRSPHGKGAAVDPEGAGAPLYTALLRSAVTYLGNAVAATGRATVAAEALRVARGTTGPLPAGAVRLLEMMDRSVASEASEPRGGRPGLPRTTTREPGCGYVDTAQTPGPPPRGSAARLGASAALWDTQLPSCPLGDDVPSANLPGGLTSSDHTLRPTGTMDADLQRPSPLHSGEGNLAALRGDTPNPRGVPPSASTPHAASGKACRAEGAMEWLARAAAIVPSEPLPSALAEAVHTPPSRGICADGETPSGPDGPFAWDGSVPRRTPRNPGPRGDGALANVQADELAAWVREVHAVSCPPLGALSGGEGAGTLGPLPPMPLALRAAVRAIAAPAPGPGQPNGQPSSPLPHPPVEARPPPRGIQGPCLNLESMAVLNSLATALSLAVGGVSAALAGRAPAGTTPPHPPTALVSSNAAGEARPSPGCACSTKARPLPLHLPSVGGRHASSLGLGALQNGLAALHSAACSPPPNAEQPCRLLHDRSQSVALACDHRARRRAVHSLLQPRRQLRRRFLIRPMERRAPTKVPHAPHLPLPFSGGALVLSAGFSSRHRVAQMSAAVSAPAPVLACTRSPQDSSAGSLPFRPRSPPHAPVPLPVPISIPAAVRRRSRSRTTGPSARSVRPGLQVPAGFGRPPAPFRRGRCVVPRAPRTTAGPSAVVRPPPSVWPVHSGFRGRAPGQGAAARASGASGAGAFRRHRRLAVDWRVTQEQPFRRVRTVAAETTPESWCDGRRRFEAESGDELGCPPSTPRLPGVVVGLDTIVATSWHAPARRSESPDAVSSAESSVSSVGTLCLRHPFRQATSRFVSIRHRRRASSHPSKAPASRKTRAPFCTWTRQQERGVSGGLSFPGVGPMAPSPRRPRNGENDPRACASGQTPGTEGNGAGLTAFAGPPCRDPGALQPPPHGRVAAFASAQAPPTTFLPNELPPDCYTTADLAVAGFTDATAAFVGGAVQGEFLPLADVIHASPDAPPTQRHETTDARARPPDAVGCGLVLDLSLTSVSDVPPSVWGASPRPPWAGDHSSQSDDDSALEAALLYSLCLPPGTSLACSREDPHPAQDAAHRATGMEQQQPAGSRAASRLAVRPPPPAISVAALVPVAYLCAVSVARRIARRHVYTREVMLQYAQSLEFADDASLSRVVGRSAPPLEVPMSRMAHFRWPASPRGGQSSVGDVTSHSLPHPRAADCALCSEPWRAVAARLPRTQPSRSALVCPVSGKPMQGSDNAPWALPSGGVCGSTALRSQEAILGHVVCPVTSREFELGAAHRLYIM